jgi:hypothetical protein
MQMTRMNFVWIPMFFALTGTASAQPFVTQPGALVCASPFQLQEARSARNDPKWLESLGCTIARAGISATWIDENSLGIKLRLHPLTSADVTVWGQSRYEFMAPAPPRSASAPPSVPVVSAPPSYVSVRTVTVPSADPVQSDSFFESLRQTITGAGYECDNVIVHYVSDEGLRMATCKIGNANATFSMATRDGAALVQKVERRRSGGR